MKGVFRNGVGQIVRHPQGLVPLQDRRQVLQLGEVGEMHEGQTPVHRRLGNTLDPQFAGQILVPREAAQVVVPVAGPIDTARIAQPGRPVLI